MRAIDGLLAMAMTGNGYVNQPAIDNVQSGKLTEARASWWGFDPADSTKTLAYCSDSNSARSWRPLSGMTIST